MPIPELMEGECVLWPAVFIELWQGSDRNPHNSQLDLIIPYPFESECREVVFQRFRCPATGHCEQRV